MNTYSFARIQDRSHGKDKKEQSTPLIQPNHLQLLDIPTINPNINARYRHKKSVSLRIKNDRNERGKQRGSLQIKRLSHITHIPPAGLEYLSKNIVERESSSGHQTKLNSSPVQAFLNQYGSHRRLDENELLIVSNDTVIAENPSSSFMLNDNVNAVKSTVLNAETDQRSTSDSVNPTKQVSLVGF